MNQIITAMYIEKLTNIEKDAKGRPGKLFPSQKLLENILPIYIALMVPK